MSLPKVSVVITAYHEMSKGYLDLCIESVLNLDYPKDKLEVILVSPKRYAPKYDGVSTISPPEETYGCPRGLNFGIANSTGELCFVLNDDVIVTKGSLKNLVQRMIPQIGILMPIGNDQQMRYHIPLPQMGPYRLETAAHLAKNFRDIDGGVPVEGLLLHDTLCIYAYLIRKSVHDELEGFDEKLICADDIDFCQRLRLKNYINAISLNAVVWHAGGATSEKTFTDDMRERGQALFRAKWAQL